MNSIPWFKANSLEQAGHIGARGDGGMSPIVGEILLRSVSSMPWYIGIPWYIAYPQNLKIVFEN
jgi:hypothetical protein